MKNVEDVYSLSPMQQGMLFHTLYEGEPGVYVTQTVYVFHGAFDVPAFQRAWQQVVERHQTLRSAFLWDGLDEPLQLVRQKARLPWQVEDWRDLAPAEQDARLAAFLDADRRRGFDLSKAPLMRLALFQVADTTYRCVWTQHHLLLDGWSVPLVFNEVLAYHDAFTHGQPLALPRPRPYRDYIAWLQRQDLAQAEAFWRRLLHGFTAPTPLIVDRPLAPDAAEARYTDQHIVLDKSTTAALQALARQHGLTLNTVVQGAWALLLSRYSGEADVVFGTTVAGRPPDLPGVETMVGLFINTLPVRVRVPQAATVLAWLQQLQQQQAELRQYEYSPLVQIQSWSAVPRGQPLFESLVVFENYPEENTTSEDGEGPTLFIEHTQTEEQGSYPLALIAVPGPGLVLRFNYDCRRFADATIARLLGHVQTLLTGMAAQPTGRLGALPLLDAAERARLLADWPVTPAAPAPTACLHDLIAAQAARTPDARALVCGDTHLTYRVLEQQATQLAYALRQHGVGPEVPVALLLERSPVQVVALLAVLKAGGAYLPLDPALPAARLQFVLADAQVPLLLTQQALLPTLPSETAAAVLCVDRDGPAIAQAPAVALPVVGPEQLAYLIYTSGSTGQPKGVQVAQRGIANLAQAQIAAFGVQADSRVLQFAALSFDAALAEVAQALVAGATLVLAPRDALLPGSALLALLREQAITHVTLPPSVLAALPDAALPALETIITAGEACPASVVARWGTRHRLINAYGPTEATVCATLGVTTADGREPAIGRPIANGRVYVLDAQLEPVPVGVAGEIYIGGIGLARGYHQQPALTAEAFLPNPYGEPGARLYATGDRGRWRADGQLEFLGRRDGQVKLRGYRIELGEVAAVLRAHPAVQDAHVLLRADPPGEPRLVAYVVATPEGAPPVSDLRSFLLSRLPAYMVPSAFVVLDALPLTPHGKVDRSALPAPEGRRMESGDAVVAPRTPIEEVLVGIWADVLHLERVSVQENFFTLGGHSLLATQVISRVREAFQVELPLRSLFEKPTVAGLAAWIEDARRAAQGMLPPPIRPVPRDRPLPLSFAQQRLWFLDQLQPNSPVYNMFLGMVLTGSLSVPALEQALTGIVARHEALRTTFAVVKGSPIQVIAPAQEQLLPLIDLQMLPEQEREIEARRLIVEEAQRPFDLAQGPLLRTILLRMDAEAHVLLTTTHHIVFDGSIDVFTRELMVLYSASVRATPHPEGTRLPELPIQYADYAVWQRGWLQGEVLEAQLAYWKQQLGGSLPVLDLPTDRPRPTVPTFQGTVQDFTLPQHLAAAITALSQREGVTLFMTMLAAWQVLLARYSGQDDILVGTPITTRSLVETEALIGCFTNTLVLRTHLAGNPSFRELLGRVREVALGAYAHQDLPFEKLVDALQPERDLSRNPLFQNMFVLQQGGPTQEPALTDLTMRFLGSESGTARFDLLLSVWTDEGGWGGSVEYNTDLFDATTIVRLLTHYQSLLEGIVANPEQRVFNLPLLTSAEQQQMLFAWNATKGPYPQHLCMHQLFEAQATRTPNAVAVIADRGSSHRGQMLDAAGSHRNNGDGPLQHLTYRELNRQANQLAHHLQQLGVGPGVLVGVYMERTIDVVPALLGILKAGGAYVPLEPSFPQARIEWILASLKIACIITQGSQLQAIHSLQPQLPALKQVICMDEAPVDAAFEALSTRTQLWTREQLDRLPAEQVSSRVHPDDLAYIIFTSGSTGTPKGVMVRHRPVVNLIDWVNRTFEIGEADQVLFITSLCFDLSVYDVFGLLAAGGSIRVVADQDIRDPERLLQIMCDEPITFWDSAPAALQQLVPFFDRVRAANRASRLRLVFLSGDWIPVTLPDQVRTTFPGASVVSLGGATEATVWSNYYPIGEVDPSWTSIPYGVPIQNAQYHILDPHLNPCPVGVAGDLYIGGLCLASGYAQEPILTASKFIPNPFSHPEGARPGARLYKTGDLARYWSDGTMEFLGRVDHQVKIRGYRIELGEIETVLAQHPDVLETAVLARADRAGERRLVAYVVSRPGRVVAINDLRSFLKERLPDYMVPAVFMFLDGLPVTSNGKLDRKALPVPDTARVDLDESFVAPRTWVEEQLAQIWSQVLGVERVGVHDNFFVLGGDSILSIQIIARANQAGLHLTPRQVFQHQTIAELAPAIGMAPAVVAEQELVEGAVPLTPIQHWFFARDLLDPHHFNQAMLLEVRRPLDRDLLEQTVRHLLIHHDALRLSFTREEFGWQQINAGVSGQPVVVEINLPALPVAEQSYALEATAAELHASLDLAGPLLKVALFNMGADQPGRLLIVIHHLAVDGVSWTILLEDLQTVYEQLEQGEQAALPPKTTAFKQWAERLITYAQSDTLRTELDYWLGLPWETATSLPVDYRGGTNTAASVQSVAVALDEDETRALLYEMPPVYQTQINDVLLTALALACERWTGAPTLLVDLEGHGREDLFDEVDLTRTVGWFTTLYPVLLDLRRADGPGAALKAVKEQLRQIPNRGLGYGVLRYLSADDSTAQLRALPQAEISFNYWGQGDQSIPTDGLFSPARESSGLPHSQRDRRSHLLEIVGIVAEGQLRLACIYSAEVHAQATIERLVQEYVAALRVLIEHCRAPEAGGYTPSDFPLAHLDQPTLDRVVGSDRQVEDLYSLSPMQQGLLFHTLYQAGSGLYVEQLAMTLEGRLDVLAFQRAWQQVVERHPIFRTAFAWEDLDEPLQLVRQQVRLPWQVEDWRELAAAEQDARLAAFLDMDRRRGFDLAEAPLMRLALFQVSDVRYRCVWTQHHLLLDGWSVPLVFNEVFAYYDAFAKGQDLYLPHPRPYRDYIAWLQRQDLAQAEAFWCRLLHGFTAPTPLMVDRPLAPDAAEARYIDQHTVIAESTTAALQALARQHGLTLNTVVQGAWALLLSRYSGEADVVFGATVAGRPADLPGVETMVGLFINTLPVRVRVPQAVTVLEWLQQLQQQQAELRQYEYSPLVQIQSWSAVPRGQPLFESLFAFENYPVGSAAPQQDDTPELVIANMDGQERTNYPLTIVAAPGPELSLRITFDNRRFEAATITRMIGHLQTILEGIAAHPERRLSRLSLVTAEEQQQLVVTWNNSAADYPRTSSIQELFEAQAARIPSAVAVVCEGQQLSYGDLNRRANQLAHHLRRLGVGPDVLVGICVERSLEMIIGILGILKAGGAYVPLDPNYPQERLQYMLEDTQTPVLLTQERLRDKLPSGQAHVVYLDADREAISQLSAANPPRTVLGEHRAYIIYTSGSTGRPKGVMVKQRGLINLCYGLQAFFDDPDISNTALITSISFDISVNQIFPTLIFGRTLHIIPDSIKFDSRAMVHYMAQNNIHLFDSVPSYLMAVLAEIHPEQVDNQLKYILIGGEKLERRLLQAVFDQLGEQVNIVNIYGLTEITDINLFSVITSRDLDQTITIGRPLNNNQIYLTDTHGNLQPIGVIGEVCVAGESLSRGYLNRPDLTAEKFVVCPWGDGALMCRTGDVGRRLADGTIELFGRIDHQVKVRGFRIELGEIEAVLRAHPTVREAVAVVREDIPGDQRLVAYIVGERENNRTKEQEHQAPSTKHQGHTSSPLPAAAGEGTAVPGGEGLRSFLKQKLPDYMVPTVLVPLETLPLTPSGKVDRKALPAPNQSLSGAQTNRVDPRDTLELKLVQIWEELLDIRPIGVTDSFFELGGHSLLVLRLMTQLKQQVGQDLPMATIFHGPTIEELACRMREHTGSDAWSPLVPLQPNGSRFPFFCVHPAGGPALCYARLAQHLGPDQSVYGLQARGLEAGQEPVQRIEEMAADYIDAIRQIQPDGPYLLGGWSMGGLVAFEMAQQLRRQDQEVGLLALIDVGAPEGSAEIGNLDDDASILLALIEEQNLSLPKADFQQLRPGEQVDLAVELLKKSGFLPPDADQEQLRRMVQVFKTNLRAMFTYRPQMYPESITLFKTAAPVAADTSELEASPDLLETTLGWSGISTQPVTVYTVPGTHETMVNEPHVRILAERLKSCIDTLDASVRSVVED